MSSGVPSKAMKTDGTHRVPPRSLRTTKAGLEGSQAVYPRASKVDLTLPQGKLDASGSPWISSKALKDSSGVPSPSTVRNAMCFSAVISFRGWNQWA